MIKERQLESFGFSNKEARLYLIALELGTFSIQEISLKTDIKRPTCYVILEKLTKRGLVSTVLTENKKRYKVESPKNFIRQAQNNLKYAEQLVPSLLSISAKNKEKPKLKYYFGQEGMRNIYEELLLTQSKSMYYVGSTKSQIETVGEEYLKDYVQRRAAIGIKVKTIRMKETQSSEPLFNQSKQLMREVRYSPEGIFIPDTVCVIGDKVAVVFTQNSNFGFIIESPEFSKTILGFFNALWMVSKEC